MFRRIQTSFINRPFKSIIIILIMSILFISLNTSFIWKDATETIYTQVNSTLKPQVVVKSDVVIKNIEDYNFSPIFYNDVKEMNSASKWEEYNNDFYNDMHNLIDDDSVYYADINLTLDGESFLVPGINANELYIQWPYSTRNSSFNTDSNILIEYEYYKESLNKNYFSVAYNHLTSVSRSDFSDIYYNSGDDDLLLAGHYFTDEDISNGAYKIILNGQAFYCDVENIKELMVGDTITYSLLDIDSENKDVIKSYDFEIIGILNNIARSTDDICRFNIIPEKTFLEIMDDIYPLIKDNFYYYYKFATDRDYFLGEYFYFPTFITLNSLDDLETFIDKIDNLNDTKGRNYTYESNADSFVSLAGQLESVFTSFNIMFVFSLIASIFILFSLITIDVSSRKREIGILMSLGEDKKYIALGFILEYLLKILIALAISLIITGFITGKISDYILTSDLAELANGTSSIFFDAGEANDTPVLSVSLSLINVFKILAIVLIISIPSILSSVLYISHFNPKEVLKDEQWYLNC